jgi:hypothetical protein
MPEEDKIPEELEGEPAWVKRILALYSQVKESRRKE